MVSLFILGLVDNGNVGDGNFMKVLRDGGFGVDCVEEGVLVVSNWG